MGQGKCEGTPKAGIDYDESMRAFKRYTEQSEAREKQMIENFSTEMTDLKVEVSELKDMLKTAVEQLAKL